MYSLERFYLAARKRLLKLSKGRFFIVRRDAGTFLIDINDHVSRQIEAYGFYEKSQLLKLHSYARGYECDKFLDVGANLGLYTIYFAARGIEAIAFEPDAKIRNHLHANIFLNQLDDDVKIEPVALSDRNALLRFQRFSDQNRGRSRISDTGESSVISIRLDDFLDWNGQRICLKVDIEGHELAFIRGATKFLSDNDCIIQMEILEQVDTVILELEKMGYQRLDEIGHDHYFSNFGMRL